LAASASVDPVENVLLDKNALLPKIVANILYAAPLTVQQLLRMQNANVVLMQFVMRVTLVLVSKE